MWRQHRSIGLSLAVLFLISCARSGFDNKVAPPSDETEAKASSIVVSGTRAVPQMADEASPMDMVAPAPPPPSAPGMYMPPNWSPPYHDVGRDRFTSAGENPFRIVREVPVSTFSIDVDTASYSWVRASLNQDVLPQPAAVRTEEMVNYFPYDYAPPRTREQPFSTNVAVFPSPCCTGTQARADRDQGLFGRASITAAREPRLPDRHVGLDAGAEQAAAGEAVA